MANTQLSLSLNTERDRDILEYADSLPPRKVSEHMRNAIRASISGQVTLADIMQELAEIKRMLRSGAVVAAQAGAADAADGADPRVADAARKIADLGL